MNMVPPPSFLDYIGDLTNQENFIKRLKDAVAIQSISGDTNPDVRQKVISMSNWMLKQLQGLGVQAEPVSLGKQTIDGKPSDLDLPPVILGKLGTDPNKKTVLVYGHLDVQPVNQEGWKTDPWVLNVDQDGRMTARGSTDDKGPCLGWLNVIEAHKALGLDLPVNMRFCFEAMEESGSEGLEDLIVKEAAKGNQGYFDNVDCMCISDNYWLNTRTPTLTYGLRGIAYFNATVSGPKTDLHSGIYGGTVFEPMTDLITILSKLVRSDGHILVDGAYEDVKPATQDEIELYEVVDYSVADLEEFAGPVALSNDKVTILMGRMRNPSLSIHGIYGASSGVESQTIIPAKVTGKFSLRIVSPQTPKEIEEKVRSYLENEFRNLGTRNKLEVVMTDGGMPWVDDYKHYNYQAAQAATEAAYGKTPDMVREGGSIPVTLSFAQNLPGVNIVLIPMGRGDDGAHSANEKLDRNNFIQGSKLLGLYLYGIAAA